MNKFTALQLVVVAACLSLSPAQRARKRPNIIFFLADDMGWGDVSWSDYPEIPTPHLASLRETGTEMMQFYTQSKCTPSRAALMTGKYPIRYGAQTSKVYNRMRNNTLDESFKLLPQYLKDLGYSTHMIGKWHLGFCSWDSIPTARGFDTFFGSWTNTKDHFHHNADGYDWNLNDKPYFAANGTYNTHLITSRTVDLLKDHLGNAATSKTPFFMYVSFLAPHKPAMVPQSYIDNTSCRNLPDGDIRKRYCGMVAALDEGVGNVTATLKEFGRLDDTIIIFTSDNGGSAKVGASSWPLRGSKQTIYEGGTRQRTLIHSPKWLGPKAPRQYWGLTHITDILPTLYNAARGSLKDLPRDLDGRSFWPQLRNGRPSKRVWMLYNMDSERKLAAIRYKKNETYDFKLIYTGLGGARGWTGRGPPEEAAKLSKSYKPPKDHYRLFDMVQNPYEYEPSAEYPDAARRFRAVKRKMIRRIQSLWKEEVPRPYWVDLPLDGPGRPINNNGAYTPGDC